MRKAILCKIVRRNERSYIIIAVNTRIHTATTGGKPKELWKPRLRYKAITGTNTKHREGFKRMVADALDGKIEIKTAELIQFDFSGAAKF